MVGNLSKMNENQRLGEQMMEAARKYPNDKIANELSRVGDLLMHQDLPFVKCLTDIDRMVVQFYRKCVA